jgi:hypothetical protein
MAMGDGTRKLPVKTGVRKIIGKQPAILPGEADYPLRRRVSGSCQLLG